MVSVPAGRYPIGRDDGPASERPRHLVDLDAFRIDRIEVTNGAFVEYLNHLRLPVRGSFAPGAISAGNGDSATLARVVTGSDRLLEAPIAELDDSDARILLVNGRFRAADGRSGHPVTEITWPGARAYCQWRGGDLPTEVQWEAAARGQDDRRYPWGNAAPDSTRVAASGRSGMTAPAGSKPGGASPFGALDMAGSLAEWTLSLKRPYPYRGDDGREWPQVDGERTTRGGDYLNDRRPDNFSVSFRDSYSNASAHGHGHIGFRCVSQVR